MFSRSKHNSILKSCILLVILFTKLYSQEFTNQYALELNPNLSNEWWSKYNNYGQELSEITLNYSGSFKVKRANYNFRVFANKDNIYVRESFVQSQLFNNTYLKAGKYYRDFSNYLNDSLSSGSLLISHNAAPMTKIGLLSSYRFKQKENIDFNFGISHGLFSNSKIYKTAPMLHEKFAYLNYAKNQNEFSIGFVHQAMWGGSTEEYGKFPDSFKDFLKIVISADGPLLEGEPHANALGNHLGIWDFHYKKITDNKELQLYYQHFFEDTSGLRFDNKSDGLWGLELSNYINNTNILFEYLNTMNQDRDPPYVNENYYNHGEYTEGWSYKGYALGNPFINHLDSNPSKVFHLGISSNEKNKYNYKLLLSRKINKSDPIKYQISIGKAINQLLVKIVITGEENQSNNMSIKLFYYL
jgi:hypothetical protein